MSSAGGYAAVLGDAAFGEIAPRRAIALSGRDRAAFLQGLLTNDVQALTAGTGCYSAWLNAQGRMLTDIYVLESGDMMLLDVPFEEHAATLARLEQFLFSEDVQFADLSESLRAVWVHGPAAAAKIESVAAGGTGFDDWPLYRNQRTEIAGASAVVARIDQLGVPGFCIYVDAQQADRLTRALGAAGVASVSHEDLEAARIDAAYPVFGVDMTHDTIPLEAGLEGRAISLTKGCYVGQEIIIRVLHRGQGRVARKLVSLTIDGHVPARGAKLWADEREIGWITSAARSPRRGPVALGYVHRDFTAAGTTLKVDLEGRRTTAQVIAGSASAEQSEIRE